MKKSMIVLHGSASRWGDVGIIRQWHLERGWSDIGYGLVIENGFYAATGSRDWERDGKMEAGRDLNDNPHDWMGEKGAHAFGYNAESIGICLIGDERTQHTRAQVRSCLIVCAYLCNLYEISWSQVMGHYELDDKKIDPYMNMKEFRDYLVSGVMAKSIPDDIFHSMMERDGEG